MFRTCGPPSAYELRTSSEFADADEDACPECGEPIGTPNAEAFETLDITVCDLCAEAALEDNDQFGVGA